MWWPEEARLSEVPHIIRRLNMEDKQQQELVDSLKKMIDYKVFQASNSRPRMAIERCPARPRVIANKLTHDEREHVRRCEVCLKTLSSLKRFGFKYPRARKPTFVVGLALLVLAVISFFDIRPRQWLGKGKLGQSTVARRPGSPVTSPPLLHDRPGPQTRLVGEGRANGQPDASIEAINDELLPLVGAKTFLKLRGLLETLETLVHDDSVIQRLWMNTLYLAKTLGSGESLIEIEKLRIELAGTLPAENRDATLLHFADDEGALAGILKPRDLVKIAKTRLTMVQLAGSDSDAVVDYSRKQVDYAHKMGSKATVVYANMQLGVLRSNH